MITATVSEYSDYISLPLFKKLRTSRKKKVRGYLRKMRQQGMLKSTRWYNYQPSAEVEAKMVELGYRG
jgi:hypothetical protein